MLARATMRTVSFWIRSHDTVKTIPMSAATETVIKNHPMPCPSPNRAPSFRLVRYQSMLGMTGHPGLVPGMPRILKAIAFVMRSAAVVTVTSVVKTVHVMRLARFELDERSVGMDPIAGCSVTACVDLQIMEMRCCVVRVLYLESRG